MRDLETSAGLFNFPERVGMVDEIVVAGRRGIEAGADRSLSWTIEALAALRVVVVEGQQDGRLIGRRPQELDAAAVILVGLERGIAGRDVVAPALALVAAVDRNVSRKAVSEPSSRIDRPGPGVVICITHRHVERGLCRGIFREDLDDSAGRVATEERAL